MSTIRPILRVALWLFAICFAAAAMAGLVWFEADPARTVKVTTYYDAPNQITHNDD